MQADDIAATTRECVSEKQMTSPKENTEKVGEAERQREKGQQKEQ